MLTSNSSAYRWLAVAALAGLLAVALDALGAHALGPSPDPARLRLLELATRYQLVHAVALIGVAALQAGTEGRPSPWLRVSAWTLTLGIIFFCGGLTLRALTSIEIAGPLVPVGGTAFVVGWAALLGHAVRTALR